MYVVHKSIYFPTLPYKPTIEKYSYKVLGLPESIYSRGVGVLHMIITKGDNCVDLRFSEVSLTNT